MVKEFFAVLAKEFERAERASVINKVKDVYFLCGYELPKEFVIVARGSDTCTVVDSEEIKGFKWRTS